MDRRRFIAVAAALGGSLSLPVQWCLATALQADDKATPAHPLDAGRMQLLGVLTERIIPETDTPGALAVGVPQFIEFMLSEGFSADDRSDFLAGLDEVEQISRQEFKASFPSLSVEIQISIMQRLEEVSFSRRLADDDPGFFQILKELTLLGYYTSKPGATEELRYVRMTKRYDGCVIMQEGDRAFFDGTALDSLI